MSFIGASTFVMTFDIVGKQPPLAQLLEALWRDVFHARMRALLTSRASLVLLGRVERAAQAGLTGGWRATPREAVFGFDARDGTHALTAQTAMHWIELSLAGTLATGNAVEALLRRWGLRLAEPRDAVPPLLVRGPAYPMVEMGARLVGVERNPAPGRRPRMVVDEGATAPTYEALGRPERALVDAAAAGRCLCELCGKERMRVGMR